MMQTELLTKRNIATIGEEITHELGAQMIRDYVKAHPADVKSYIIGKEIINQILAQPGCVGIQFYNAINESGQKTLVYVGLDANGTPMVSYKSVNNQGFLAEEKGIVADKVRPADDGGFETWWEFFE
ncbi:hypothetical protein FAM09_27735 [Niastella caeni]|uniref:Uncharacterized protein n=1 Tax=Niastella caeni TaxID=2569763 RepID=A0A4S8HD02_9BACT|nr:hypothetical protein [Niastella caeni]THU31979.1 hypothetical protein FAM09_27735 [Niastella caeni]